MVEFVDIAKSFGSQDLFAKVNFRIGERDRVGLVGPNGTGKTTLFRILLGEISADSGRVEVQKGIRIGHLPQDVSPSRAGQLSLLDYCCRTARGIGDLLTARAECLHTLEHVEASEAVTHRLAEIEDRLAAAQAETIEAEASSVLMGLGFSQEELGRPLSTMSGGLLMRVELARLLLDRPNLLLLDEPTNHLDLEGIVWFENYLDNFPGSVVMVAHDREFLNRTVHRVVELSRRGATDFGGSRDKTVYDRYVEERAKAIEIAWRRYDEQQAQIKDIEDFIARNRVNKARASLAQSRIRVLEKMERLVPPSRTRSVRLSFPQPPRAPDLVIGLDGVQRRYGEKVVFDGLDLRLHRGEKVALVGVNGAGKSTLLRLVAGTTVPDGGERALADGVRVGYFAQDQYEVLNPERTLEEHMLEVADTQTAPHIKSILGAFLFGDNDYSKKVVTLSGGEKARLMLARMLLRPCGLLILDEPTNHLDIESREILEAALKQHAGTILFTTHDRRFMDNVATTVFELRDGVLSRYPGNYSYYLSKAEPSTVDARSFVETDPDKADRRAKEKAQKRDEAERRNTMYRILKPIRERVDSYEAEIDALETELRVLDAELISPSLYDDLERARRTGARAKELRTKLDEVFVSWSEAVEELENVEKSGMNA